jgi:hypothetical protein
MKSNTTYLVKFEYITVIMSVVKGLNGTSFFWDCGTPWKSWAADHYSERLFTFWSRIMKQDTMHNLHISPITRVA